MFNQPDGGQREESHIAVSIRVRVGGGISRLQLGQLSARRIGFNPEFLPVEYPMFEPPVAQDVAVRREDDKGEGLRD